MVAVDMHQQICGYNFRMLRQPNNRLAAPPIQSFLGFGLSLAAGLTFFASGPNVGLCQDRELAKSAERLAQAVKGDDEKAISLKKNETIRQILSHDPDMTQRGGCLDTTLGYAISYGVDRELVARMAAKSDLSLTEKTGQNFLYTACYNKRWDIANDLIGLMNDDQINGHPDYRPIKLACMFSRNNISTVEALLERNCILPREINYQVTILSWAISNRSTKSVKQLLARDVDVSAQGNFRFPPIKIPYRPSNCC